MAGMAGSGSGDDEAAEDELQSAGIRLLPLHGVWDGCRNSALLLLLLLLLLELRAHAGTAGLRGSTGTWWHAVRAAVVEDETTQLLLQQLLRTEQDILQQSTQLPATSE